VKTDKHIKRSDGCRVRHVPLVAAGFVTLWVALVSFLGLPRLGQAQNGENGKELFEKRCSGCHALDKEKEGPRLRGVYGRMSGTVISFQYSNALKTAHITWDATTLDKWLTDPEKLVPDSDMAFQLVKAEERSDIIAYLKQLSSH
jgi:cytochrome c